MPFLNLESSPLLTETIQILKVKKSALWQVLLENPLLRFYRQALDQERKSWK
jgi:hypothetical protein